MVRSKEREEKSIMQKEKYPIICLCGSSTQKQDWEYWQKQLTLEGNCVLAINIYYGLEVKNYNEETETKRLLGEIHKQKIRMSDKVIFIEKPDGTLGEHTSEELEYAQSLGKKIAYVYSVATYL